MKNVLSNKHERAIESLVTDYVRENGILGFGQTLTITLDVALTSMVRVRTKKLVLDRSPAELDKLLATLIQDIDFGEQNSYVQSQLAAAPRHIVTLGQLVRIDREAFYGFRNFGEKRIDSIMKIVESFGLRLGIKAPIGPIEQRVLDLYAHDPSARVE